MEKDKLKILVCEDEETLSKAIKNILTKRKFEVFICRDGEESLQKAREINPDLIIVDIRMPKIDGIEVVKQIRQFNNQVKIIFLTAFQSPQIIQEVSQYDILDYIVKPVAGEKLIEAVSKAFSA